MKDFNPFEPIYTLKKIINLDELFIFLIIAVFL